MTAYQIPQFLDSGDKIFLDMNIRQFAYALVGFLICVIIFNIFFTLLGNFTWGLIVPPAAFTLYLAKGKYNGRDSEVYILKSILYVTKPRKMFYARVPILNDLYARLADLNFDKKLASLTANVAQDKTDDLNFELQDNMSKLQTITNLGKSIDESKFNSAKAVIQAESKIEGHRVLIDELSVQK
jgi:PrgI family protein